MHNAPILSTFIMLSVVIKTLFCLFLSGRFTQVLLYVCFSCKSKHNFFRQSRVHFDFNKKIRQSTQNVGLTNSVFPNYLDIAAAVSVLHESGRTSLFTLI